MTRLRGRSPFGAAKARVPLHFHENPSNKMDGRINPDQAGDSSGNGALQAVIHRNLASSGLIPSCESIINPRLSLAA
jgi:hypothetical protein